MNPNVLDPEETLTLWDISVNLKLFKGRILRPDPLTLKNTLSRG